MSKTMSHSQKNSLRQCWGTPYARSQPSQPRPILPVPVKTGTTLLIHRHRIIFEYFARGIQQVKYFHSKLFLLLLNYSAKIYFLCLKKICIKVTFLQYDFS